MTTQPCILQEQILPSALTALNDIYLTMKIINRKVFCIFFCFVIGDGHFCSLHYYNWLCAIYFHSVNYTLDKVWYREKPCFSKIVQQSDYGFTDTFKNVIDETQSNRKVRMDSESKLHFFVTHLNTSSLTSLWVFQFHH